MRRGAMLPAALCLLACLLAGCARSGPDPAGAPRSVSDLAYDSKTDACGRVYLREGDSYVPFLVLENDSEGGTLLLREYVLDETRPYNGEDGDHPSLYAGSDIDGFLNGEYLDSLSESDAARILTTQVEVTTEGALERMRAQTERIPRRVFLLSAAEACAEAGSLTALEGRSLGYFRRAERKLAVHADGSPATWFTRTPVLSERAVVLSIDGEGVVGLCPLASAVGPSRCSVRPALRVPSDTPLASAELDGAQILTLGP